MAKKHIPAIPASVFSFLIDLRKHNNRNWFTKHKDRYTESHELMIEFADYLLQAMNSHDLIETPSGRKSLHRIYRDIRFLKVKTPYKSNWSGSFSRQGKNLRGGYYYHIEPGNSYVAGGFFAPNPGDLARIRQEIVHNAAEFRSVLKSKAKLFGTMEGDSVKTAPQGYLPSHPEIDLLRLKQFVLRHRFTDKEVLSPGFATQLNQTFRHMRPFFDFMSDVLSTDVNGAPTLEHPEERKF
jgi:uncharacterized protein (TIGR02453 family)